MIPYGRHSVDEEDIRAVVEALRSDWLTTGPRVEHFEASVASFTGAAHAVAMSSGTAALHAAMHVLGIGPGDEVIVPAITFVATANAAVFLGGTPRFADVDPETLLIDPASVEAQITPCTKAIVAVDFAGQPADYDALRQIANHHQIALVADACHSLGGDLHGKRVGTLADLTVLSFHPVKHITTGEGGMLLTQSADKAGAARRFRNHGIATDQRTRAAHGTWRYEMIELGYNYRITDLQCALGVSQLRKLDDWIERRRALARRYHGLLAGTDIRPLRESPGTGHAYHLYVVRMTDREAAFRRLRAAGVGANVHYAPVYLHPYYRRRFDLRPGLCPRAERVAESLLTLPLFPAMLEAEQDHVLRILLEGA